MDGEKLFPLPARDPVSGGALVITELQGPETGITIRGHFEMPRFAQLSADQARYLETFLRCRGMLNSVEKELGISYPTARARLDAVLRALDLHAVREDASPSSEEATATFEPVESPEPTPAWDEPAAGEEVQAEAPAEHVFENAAFDAPVEEEPVDDVPFYEQPIDDEPVVLEEPVVQEPAPTSRRSRDEILTLLEKGEITPEDAKRELAQ